MDNIVNNILSRLSSLLKILWRKDFSSQVLKLLKLLLLTLNSWRQTISIAITALFICVIIGMVGFHINFVLFWKRITTLCILIHIITWCKSHDIVKRLRIFLKHCFAIYFAVLFFNYNFKLFRSNNGSFISSTCRLWMHSVIVRLNSISC